MEPPTAHEVLIGGNCTSVDEPHPANRQANHIRQRVFTQPGSISTETCCPRHVRYSPDSDRTADIAACVSNVPSADISPCEFDAACLSDRAMSEGMAAGHKCTPIRPWGREWYVGSAIGQWSPTAATAIVAVV